MKFTKKDVENLKTIRDSDDSNDLELNDDLIDSLNKFTVYQGYLDNLNYIF